MAVMATKNRDDALDIVQDAMLSFARRYSEKSDTEWPPLFYRVLQNQIRDWYRRQQVRKAFEWFSQSKDTEHLANPSESVSGADDPVYHLQQEGLRNDILEAVSNLSLRQQQVFLLRNLGRLIGQGYSCRHAMFGRKRENTFITCNRTAETALGERVERR